MHYLHKMITICYWTGHLLRSKFWHFDHLTNLVSTALKPEPIRYISNAELSPLFYHWCGLWMQLSFSFFKVWNHDSHAFHASVECILHNPFISGGQSRRFWAILVPMLAMILMSILKLFYIRIVCELFRITVYSDRQPPAAILCTILGHMTVLFRSNQRGCYTWPILPIRHFSSPEFLRDTSKISAFEPKFSSLLHFLDSLGTFMTTFRFDRGPSDAWPRPNFVIDRGVCDARLKYSICFNICWLCSAYAGGGQSGF
jgi:hypothetical protein